MKFNREDHVFSSQGVACAGWLYRPVARDNFPIVIMANGLGLERSFGLPAFAERFAAMGIAVFLFDYRYIGDSGGSPRQLVNPFKQVKDWEAALAYVKTLSGADCSKIGLFGISFSGGHVIVTASRNPEIRCVISQVPFVDGIATMAEFGFSEALKGFIPVIRDFARLLTFRKPYYIPIVAEPGTNAFMNAEDALSGYMSLVPQNSSWENRTAARLALTGGFYRPVKVAHKIKCPCLMLLAEKESFNSPAATAKTAALIPDCTFITLPCKHFDTFKETYFEEAIKIEEDFLGKELLDAKC